MAAANTEESPNLVLAEEMPAHSTYSFSHWDPCLSKDWDKEKPSHQCILRIKR